MIKVNSFYFSLLYYITKITLFQAKNFRLLTDSWLFPIIYLTLQ